MSGSYFMIRFGWSNKLNGQLWDSSFKRSITCVICYSDSPFVILFVVRVEILCESLCGLVHVRCKASVCERRTRSLLQDCRVGSHSGSFCCHGQICTFCMQILLQTCCGFHSIKRSCKPCVTIVTRPLMLADLVVPVRAAPANVLEALYGSCL